MKKKVIKNLIGVINLVVIITAVTYMLGGFEDKPAEKPRGDLVSAVGECQELIKAEKRPLKVKFDNAFKYKGTKELIKGYRFQVSGQVNYGGIVSKPYGCLMLFENNNYKVEVIL